MTTKKLIVIACSIMLFGFSMLIISIFGYIPIWAGVLGMGIGCAGNVTAVIIAAFVEAKTEPMPPSDQELINMALDAEFFCNYHKKHFEPIHQNVDVLRAFLEVEKERRIAKA